MAGTIDAVLDAKRWIWLSFDVVDTHTERVRFFDEAIILRHSSCAAKDPVYPASRLLDLRPRGDLIFG